MVFFGFNSHKDSNKKAWLTGNVSELFPNTIGGKDSIEEERKMS
jgi:hypothetical protein